MSSIVFERGQIYWTRLNPVIGAEMAKTRPCVILSANEVNRRRNTVVIVPLTSTKTASSFPLLIEVPSAGAGSKLRPEHMRGVDKSRLGALIGRVSESDLDAIARSVAKVLVLV
jgi:mRNA interferase MazF